MSLHRRRKREKNGRDLHQFEHFPHPTHTSLLLILTYIHVPMENGGLIPNASQLIFRDFITLKFVNFNFLSINLCQEKSQLVCVMLSTMEKYASEKYDDYPKNFKEPSINDDANSLLIQ